VGYYPPVEAFGSSFVDGAAVWDIDIPAAINTCSSLGYSEDNIVVDVLMTTNKVLVFEDTSDFNSVHMLYRYLQIARYYGTLDGIKRAQFAYPGVDFRYVVAPADKLPHYREPLKMDPTDMESMFEMGITDAKNAIAAEKGSLMKDLMNQYAEVKQIKGANASNGQIKEELSML